MVQPIPFPTDAFSPYAPSEADPWDTAKVGHFLRRTCFGGNAERHAAILKQSPGEAVDALLDYDPAHDPLNDLIDKVDGLLLFNKPDTIQSWWFYRMLYNPHPFQERIALFWHNRFATSASKVGDGEMMHNQIELFRRQGLGNYRGLLVDVGRDPAMLVWLDGRTNRKGRPNENYGREVMELFTLGVGNYTEADVKNLARCYTGWTTSGPKAVFNKNLFDDGEKELFGARGKWDGETAVDVLLGRPTAATYFARKLLREFVHPSPPENAVEHYGQRIVANKWEIKPTVREMLTSRMFFSEWAYRSKIKSPCDIVVGSAVSLPGGKPSTQFLRDSAARMGQSLLYPPNVKGWDGEEAWINANTVLQRFNYGMALATQRRDEFARRTDFEGWMRAHDIKTAEDVLGHYAMLLLDDKLPPDSRQKFLDYLNSDEKNKPKAFVLNQSTVNSKVKGLIHLLMATPEYQLA